MQCMYMIDVILFLYLALLLSYCLNMSVYECVCACVSVYVCVSICVCVSVYVCVFL
jgi:hypothetical protein